MWDVLNFQNIFFFPGAYRFLQTAIWTGLVFKKGYFCKEKIFTVVILHFYTCRFFFSRFLTFITSICFVQTCLSKPGSGRKNIKAPLLPATLLNARVTSRGPTFRTSAAHSQQWHERRFSSITRDRNGGRPPLSGQRWATLWTAFSRAAFCQTH